MGRNRPKARQGSVYIAVTGTAILVSLIGFTSIHLSRLELKSATAQNERDYARHLAQSGVEFAMAAIDLDPNWRTNYFHGTENLKNPMGVVEDIVFRFLDNTDSNLGNDATQDVEIQGIGRCGSAEFRYSVDYAPSVTPEQQVSPPILQSYVAGTDTFEKVNSGAFFGQHFIPTLPGGATSWSITHIDVYLEGHGSPSATLTFNFYSSDPNDKPGTLIESLAIPEASLPPNGSPAYHQFNLSNSTGLIPGQGYCFTLEQTGGGNAAIFHYKGSVTQTNTHMLRGGSGSWIKEFAQAPQYRVNGSYTTATANGPFTISPGSWQRVAVP